MSHRNYPLVSGALFSLVAIAHLLRLVYRVPVTVDGYTVPMFVSLFGCIVPALLAAWAFRLARSAG